MDSVFRVDANDALVHFNNTTCAIPVNILNPYLELVNYSDYNLDLLWPCQVREYWILLQPFVNIVRALLTYVTSFIIISGVALNILSFTLLSTSIFNDSNLSLYLKTLAVSDIGALIFNYATNIARSQSFNFNKLFMNSKFLCAANSVTMELFQFTSTWLVACLTWARLYAVTFPLGKFNNHSVVFINIVGLVILSFAVSLTKLYFTGYESDSVFEFVPCHKKAISWKSAMHVYIALSTWLPLIFIFFGNVLLIVNIKKTESARSHLIHNAAGKISLRVNRTLFAVSLVHLILLLPLGIVETIELFWDIVLVRYPSREEKEQELYIYWLQKKLLLKWCRGKKFRVNVLEALKQWTFYKKFHKRSKSARTSKAYFIHTR